MSTIEQAVSLEEVFAPVSPFANQSKEEWVETFRGWQIKREMGRVQWLVENSELVIKATSSNQCDYRQKPLSRELALTKATIESLALLFKPPFESLPRFNLANIKAADTMGLVRQLVYRGLLQETKPNSNVLLAASGAAVHEAYGLTTRVIPTSGTPPPLYHWFKALSEDYKKDAKTLVDSIEYRPPGINRVPALTDLPFTVQSVPVDFIAVDRHKDAHRAFSAVQADSLGTGMSGNIFEFRQDHLRSFLKEEGESFDSILFQKATQDAIDRWTGPQFIDPDDPPEKRFREIALGFDKRVKSGGQILLTLPFNNVINPGESMINQHVAKFRQLFIDAFEDLSYACVEFNLRDGINLSEFPWSNDDNYLGVVLTKT